MHKLLDEKELLLQLKAGEQTAFDELFRRYYKYLVVIAFRYVKEENQAKDMVQEVFLDVWKRRESITIQDAKAYLRRAVINGCLSTIRKNKRLSYEEDPVARTLDHQSNVDNIYAYKELEEVIEQAIESLPDRCREVFKLSRQENLSHKEIAAQLSISTKTIENQMTKALKVIRLALKEYGLLLLVVSYLFFGS